ncbi:MAG: hypothetical protein JW742_00695 [Candidatus Aminicenantes bacterium]|nr:hypothetical protein [Candidatus Aminicenantes bacterium]
MNDPCLLRSWKEISRYLGCDRKTCARWETECGLPVRRIDPVSRRSRVFAYQSEVDQWLVEKRAIASLSHQKTRSARGFFVPAAAAGLILAAAFLLKTAGVIAPSPRVPLLAVQSVLSSGSPDEDYFLVEGFQSEIQRRLTASGRLQICRPASAALRKALDDASLSAAGRPDYTLESSLKRVRDRPALSVSLRRRRGNEVLWSGAYEDLAERLGVCLRDVCDHVCAALKIKPPERSVPTPEPANADDFEPYLTARFLLSRVAGDADDPLIQSGRASYYSLLDDEEANELAFKLFNQLLGGNPRFAPAILGLAQCYVNNVNLGVDGDLRWLDRAEEKIRQAEAIEPGLPDYDRLRIQCLILRDILDGGDRSQACFALAEKGLAAHPRDAGLNAIVGYGWFLEFGRSGRDDDFEKAFQFKWRAFWGDPGSTANVVLAELLMLRGDFEEALRICSLIQPGPHAYWLDNRRAEIYFYMGEADRSEAILDAQTDPRADLTGRYLRGMIAAGRRDASAARRILDEIDRLHPPKGSPFVDTIWYASILAGIGEFAAAGEALRKFSADRKAQTMRNINQLYVDINPNFGPMRGQMIVAKKGKR